MFGTIVALPMCVFVCPLPLIALTSMLTSAFSKGAVSQALLLFPILSAAQVLATATAMFSIFEERGVLDVCQEAAQCCCSTVCRSIRKPCHHCLPYRANQR